MEDYRKTKLYKAIDEVMHYIWDPIGVSDAPPARDEYYTYSAHVYKMVIENASQKDIAEYLYHTEKETIGLESAMENCMRIVGIILDWAEYLRDTK